MRSVWKKHGKRSFPAFLSTLALVAAVTGCGGTRVEKPAIRAGLGETVITPKENLRMRGFARSQVATGTHDDLHTRTLVVEGADGATVALMSISLCGVDRDIVEKIRAGVNEKTGIPAGSILISCTHTHAGPSLGRGSESYRSFLVEQSVASAEQAWTSRFPARIGAGVTEVFELGRNRRKLLYGGLHPDPQVPVLKIEDETGKLRGVLFNYGCHPSALDWRNTLYSEDWAYYAIRDIKNELGADVWAAYFQGCEGDINVGYLSELSAVGVFMPIRNYGYIEKKGRQMADAVVEALPAIGTSGNPAVRAAIGAYDYPPRDSFPVSLADAEKAAETAQRKLGALEKDESLEGTRILDEIRVEVFQTGQRLRTARRFYSTDRSTEPLEIEQQAARIGDAVFVTVPGEVFSELGVRIKEGSPLKPTFILGVSNGYGGYLPTEKEFIEGDYEVDGCRYSSRAGDVCVSSSLAVIGKVAE